MKHMLLKSEDLKKDMAEPVADESPEPRYPYGLEIRLGEESLDTLGRSVKDFSAGQEIAVRARAKVRSVTDVESMEGEDVYPSSSVEMQITHLELKPRDDFEETWEDING